MESIIKHESLVEKIVLEIEKKILDGSLKPGERIIEEALCRTLGVSRSPLREAFRILESRGFVTREPRKGISIAQITPEEADEIYVIRANLESLATFLAVKKQDPDVLKKLKKLHQQMVDVAKKGNTGAYFNLNLKFHDTLIGACGNKRLIQLIETFSKQTMRYRLEAVAIKGWMQSSVEVHEAILESFASGDAKKAELIRKKGVLGHIQRFAPAVRKE
jgi:DNA-binding GntR family transcriptional regulator